MKELQTVAMARADMAELTKLSSKNVLVAQPMMAPTMGSNELAEQESQVFKRLPRYMVKLVGDYHGRYYYFEILECARKLLLVCIPVFFDPQGSIGQLMFGLLVCFVTFGVYSFMQPYKNANTLAILAQVTSYTSLLQHVLSLCWLSLPLTSDRTFFDS